MMLSASCRCALSLLLFLGTAGGAQEQEMVVRVEIDRPLHSINPEIYGVNFASPQLLRDLNLPLNRSGGNSATLYNWRIDARNAGEDWFFESLPASAAITDQFNHGFVDMTHQGGAKPMVTIPIIGWTAILGPAREKLAAYSVRKYGQQRTTDTAYFPDAGDGVAITGEPIANNDPMDAAQPSGIEETRARVADLVARWGRADAGGIAYYILDNEPSLWHRTHRQVRPKGAHAREIARSSIAAAAAIKAIDPSARIVAPEEWGWTGYFDSGFDQQVHARGGAFSVLDRVSQTGGMDYLPYLLQMWRDAGHPVDVVSVHFYPQGGEYPTPQAGPPALQRLRNESTRLLWDADYKEKSWIRAPVGLIPRLRHWVDSYYRPGTPIAITEYSWGGDDSMSGAVAQADIWGIFGRENLDLAARWTAPAEGTPVYRAMALIRNYDGRGGAFGNLSLRVSGADPDRLSVFAARRQADGALTLLVINKALDEDVPLRMMLVDHGKGGGKVAAEATVYRLVDGSLSQPDRRTIRNASLADRLPRQSISLYVIAANEH